MSIMMRRIVACAIASVVAGAASAETRLRVRNDAEQPAEVTIDKKSRELRARKAYNFVLTAPTAALKVAFANGDVNYGEVDVGPFLAVKNPGDGHTYYCMTIDTEDFEILGQEACAGWVVEEKK